MKRKGLDGRIVEGMENRDLFMAVAIVAVVLAAVLAATYLLLAALAGPTPAPAPSPHPSLAPSATPAPSATVPSGPTIPSGPPIGSPSGNYPVVPTPVQPLIRSAELVGWGTDRDSYSRGDTASTYIVLKNTGTATINDARLDVQVERYVSVIGYVNVQNSNQPLSYLGVQPGETKKVEYNVTIPVDYEGISTAGKYRFTVKVSVWDKEIGTFQKEVQVN